MALLDLCIQTPSEKLEFEEKSRPEDPVWKHKEVREALKEVTIDIQKRGTRRIWNLCDQIGIKESLQLIQTAQTTRDLPPKFCKLVNILHKRLIEEIVTELRDPNRLKKVDRAFQLLPTR